MFLCVCGVAQSTSKEPQRLPLITKAEDNSKAAPQDVPPVDVPEHTWKPDEADKKVAGKEVPPKISAEDRLALRDAQVDTLQALAALHETREYKLVEQLTQRQQSLFAATNQKYHVDLSKLELCDGPQDVNCKDVPHGTIEYRELPKKEAKK